MPQELPFSAEEEARLIRRCQRGERMALGILVEAYRTRAFAAAMSLVRNEEDARDLSQEAFVKAIKALDRFDPTKRFLPWYYRILKNLCLTHLRRHSTRRQVSLDAMLEDNPAAEPGRDGDVVDRIHRRQMAAHLRAAIDRLSPNDREIIMMNHYEEMDYASIAEALRIPIGTVMSRLFNARKRLATLMEPHREK